jgi:hypothetical protein
VFICEKFEEILDYMMLKRGQDYRLSEQNLLFLTIKLLYYCKLESLSLSPFQALDVREGSLVAVLVWYV